MSLEREFLFISVRHSFSHLILPGIRVPLESSTTRTTTRAGETGGEKLLSLEDVTEMAEQRLQNYGTYLNIGEPQSRKVYRRRFLSRTDNATQLWEMRATMTLVGRNYRDLINPSVLEAV